MVVPDAPPLPKDFSTSPMVHTPKRAAYKIEQHKIEQGLESPSEKTIGYKAEEPITVGLKRFPNSPFPKRLSPTPYCKPGTPYRKVDLLGTEELEPETLGAGILEKSEDSFEVDPESERTLIEKNPQV